MKRKTLSERLGGAILFVPRLLSGKVRITAACISRILYLPVSALLHVAYFVVSFVGLVMMGLGYPVESWVLDSVSAEGSLSRKRLWEEFKKLSFEGKVGILVHMPVCLPLYIGGEMLMALSDDIEDRIV